MSLRLARFAAAAIAASGFAAAAQAATPVSGQVGATSNAIYGEVTVSDTDADSWAGVPATLTFATDAQSGNGDGSYVRTYQSGFASYAAAVGQVNLTAGWDFVANDTEDFQHADFGGSTVWSYTFTADGDGIFALTYNVLGQGFTFGLDGWNIDWDGDGGGLNLTEVNDPTTSGVFLRNILGGQTYTVALSTFGNVETSGNNFSGSMTGDFTWAIDEAQGAVPEPAAWAIMLLGFGAAGAVLRRRRTAVAA